MKIVISILGILVVMAIMYLLSASKKDVPLKTVLKALGIQFIIAFILVKFPLGRLAIEKVSDVVTQVLTYGMDGISFVFGSLANSSAPTGSIFGIQTLGNTALIASGSPLRPSMQAINISLTPRLLKSLQTLNQNFAPSASPIQMPNISL